MLKDVFVPLSKATTERIRAVTTLPLHLGERIGVNVPLIHRTLQLGGLRTLRIETNPDRKKTEVQPRIVGMNSQGGAVGTMAITKEVPTFDSQMGGDSVRNKQANWLDLTLLLNVEEMKQRIAARHNIHDAVAWSHEIHAILKWGIVRAGLKHLLVDGDVIECIGGLMFLSAFLLAISRPTFSEKMQDLAIYVLIRGINSVQTTLFYGREQSGEGYRLGVVPHFEIERAIALLAVAHQSPFSKVLPPQVVPQEKKEIADQN